MSFMRDIAIQLYAQKGVKIFPCCEKKPLTPRGFLDATSDEATVRAWWEKWPKAQVAMPTGAGNHLLALDADGSEAVAWYRAQHWTETAEILTSPEHYQFHYRQPDGIVTRCSASVLAPQIDVRGDGGYVIAPYSFHHETHKAYAYLKNIPWAEAPASLLKLVTANGKNSTTRPNSDRIPQGRRHQTLLKFAGGLRARRLSPEAVLAGLVSFNSQFCDPPLEPPEVQKLASYVAGKPPGFRGATMETAAEVQLEYFTEIAREKAEWLWPNRIPRGKLTIFCGDPGMGKSLASIDLAARLSRGAAFPDGSGCTLGDTIILSAEDGYEDTVAPRLDAALADSSHIARVSAVKVLLADGTSGESLFSLERDLEKLAEAVAKHPAIRLLIVDPLSAFLGKVDSHRDAEVRQILAPLVDFAARSRIACLGIMHLRKSEAVALLRVSGSVGFVACARAVWGFGEDPDDPTQRVMIPIKNNLAPLGAGLAYQITTNGVAPFIVWQEGAVHADANAVLSGAPQERHEPGALEEAMNYLEEEVLADGPKLVDEIRAQIKRDGYKWRTIERAKAKLKVAAVKSSLTGGWSWRLTTAKDRHEDRQ